MEDDVVDALLGLACTIVDDGGGRSGGKDGQTGGCLRQWILRGMDYLSVGLIVS